MSGLEPFIAGAIGKSVIVAGSSTLLPALIVAGGVICGASIVAAVIKDIREDHRLPDRRVLEDLQRRQDRLLERAHQQSTIIVRRINAERFELLRIGSLFVFTSNTISSFTIHFDFEILEVRRTLHTFRSFSGGSRPQTAFRTDGFLTGREAAAYTRGNVRNRLNALLGNQRSRMYTRDGFVLDRGHLVASADFQSAASRIATFSYGNVVPMHHSVNIGIWRSIENWSRNQADRVQIISGTLGVLHLENQYGRRVPIYLLENNRIPVPEWIYKVVILPNGDSFIFLVYNNTCSAVLPAPTFSDSILFGDERFAFNGSVTAVGIPRGIVSAQGKFVVHCFRANIFRSSRKK